MKSYKEMADSVFSRITEEKTIESKKHHNRVYMASTMAVFGLVILIGAGVWLNGQITVGEPGPNPDSETGTQIEQSVEKVKKTIYKDIVFSNDLRGEFGANESIPEHIIDIEKYIADEEALYACYVVQSEGTFEVEPLEREEGETDASYDVREQMHRAEAMAECFMDKGLMVMPSYPYCMYNNEDVFSIRGDKASFDNKCILGECLVVGTYEQLMEVFDNSEPINGAFFCVANAPRPDIFDQILGTVPEMLVSDIQAVENEIIIRYADELPEFLGSDYCEFTVDLETYENATVENDYTIIYKDISFRNYYRAQFVDDVVLTKNTIWSYFSEEDDKNALYAFCVYGGGNVYVEKQRENETQSEYQIRYQQAMSQSAASKALEMGLMVLLEYKYCGLNNDNLMSCFDGYEKGDWYPYCGQCVVVGTLDQIYALFQNTEPIDGNVWQLFTATRPDWHDIMIQAGLTDEEMRWVYQDSGTRKEDIQAIIGTDKYVTLTVPVMVPKEHVETE